MKTENKSIEEQHINRLRNNLKKTDTERFLMTTQLMKIGIMLKHAEVTHHQDKIDIIELENIKRIRTEEN